MFAIYTYNSSPTPTNVFQDIIDILTGETNPANLSADCNQAATSILTTYEASPWTVHDALAGTDKQVLTVTQADSGDSKFLGLKMTTGTTPKPIQFSISSAWDAGAHTGTDEFVLTSGAITAAFQENTTGTIWLYATRELIMFMQIQANGQYGNDGGGSGSRYGTTICAEHTRGPSTQIGDQPNWFVTTTANLGPTNETLNFGYTWSARQVSTTNVVSVVKPGSLGIGSIDRNLDDNSGTNLAYSLTIGAVKCQKAIGSFPDELPQFKPETIVAGAKNHSSPNLSATTIKGNVSTKCDIWTLPPGSLNVGTLMHWQGKIYKVWKAGFNTSTTGVAVGNKFIAPYG